jgi:hypothetical protein
MSRQAIPFENGLVLLAMGAMIFERLLVLGTKGDRMNHPEKRFVERKVLFLPLHITGGTPGRFLPEKPMCGKISYPPLKRQVIQISSLRESFKNGCPFKSHLPISINPHSLRSAEGC